MRQPARGPDGDLWVLSPVQGRVLTVTPHDGAQRDLQCIPYRAGTLPHRAGRVIIKEDKLKILNRIDDKNINMLVS